MSSGGLAPSKSTVYVSNLPFSLTNNDLHKLFEKHGRVAKVTIAKDKDTRQSKGVAFVLFIDKESAHKCVQALNGTELFKRTIKCSIAKDNGRAPEFIRRKVYKDKTKCYECGEEGHLSYECPHNLLGAREPPPKKEKKKRKQDGGGEDEMRDYNYDSDDNAREPSTSAVPPPDTLAAAILYQQQIEEEAGRQLIEFSGLDHVEPQRKKYKKDSYFSDEEELD